MQVVVVELLMAGRVHIAQLDVYTNRRLKLLVAKLPICDAEWMMSDVAV